MQNENSEKSPTLRELYMEVLLESKQRFIFCESSSDCDDDDDDDDEDCMFD